MMGRSPLGDNEKERSALLEEASRIVAAASAQGRPLTSAEDSHVLALMNRVLALEKEIGHLKRRNTNRDSDT
jgi:hypothetical protein